MYDNCMVEPQSVKEMQQRQIASKQLITLRQLIGFGTC